MTAKRGKGLQARFIAWQKTNVSPKAFLMIAALVTGIITSLVCVFMKDMTSLLSNALTSGLDNFSSNYILFLLPLTGLLITRVLTTYVFCEDLSHGTEQLIGRLEAGRTNLPVRDMYAPAIANIFTLGFGGSAGSEGPIASSGAAIGSNVARWFGISPDKIAILIGCGAGAGISAIFKAPIGGMLFTLEILRIPFTTYTVLVLLMGSITSWALCFVCTGFTFDVFLKQTTEFELSMYPALILFGIIAGFYSLYYSWIGAVVTRLFKRIGRPWAITILAGLILGTLLFFFPSLYGDGYDVMDRVLNGDFGALVDDSIFATGAPNMWHYLLLTAILLLVKAIAVPATTNGGVAGDFAPTLFAGSMAGLLFALLFNQITGGSLPAGDFALIGMSAVFSGIIRAPLMAMFLTSEMTGNFTLFLPMVVASALAYGVVRIWTNVNYYHQKLHMHIPG